MSCQSLRGVGILVFFSYRAWVFPIALSSPFSMLFRSPLFLGTRVFPALPRKKSCIASFFSAGGALRTETHMQLL